MQQSRWRRLGVILVLALLLVGVVALSAPQEAEAAWCTMEASWVGQNGWQGLNPNFEVWFDLDVGQHQPYYIYLGPNYVSPSVLSPHGLYSGTTRFGIDTTWALQQAGWLNASNWTIDYSC